MAGAGAPAPLAHFSLGLLEPFEHTGTLTRTLAGITFSATATAGAGMAQTEAPAPLPHLSLLMYESPYIIGTVNKTLAPLTCVAVGDLPGAEIWSFDFDDKPSAGAAYSPQARNVDWWQGDVQLREDAGGLFGVVIRTLAPLASVSAAGIEVAGTTAQTLAALTSSAAGDVTVTATLARAFNALTCVAAADVNASFVATLSATLAPVTASAAANLHVGADAAPTLAPLTLAATGAVSGGLHVGTLVKTLARLTLATTGGPGVDGTLDRTLQGINSNIAGSALGDIVAVLYRPLDELACTATAAVTQYELGVRRRRRYHGTEHRIGGRTVHGTEREITGELVE